MNCKAVNSDKESIFLTFDEAVRAICIDFRQYPPQTMLFAGILPLISDNKNHLKREPGKNGAWINRPGQHNMHWLDGPKLTAYLCDAISNTHWDDRLLADVCSRVFQTRALPTIHPDTGNKGVLIETNMENFSCRQCGNCCRSLDYHNELTETDISRWKTLGRHDILNWVEVINHNGADEQYRIWVSPKTHRLTETCPFLKKEPTSNRWQCLIHDVKPGICRQYPISRKHALMTGCLGFNK